MDAHDAIARRTSTRAFKPDAVPRYAIERLLAAAVRAPNHKLTEPWRFAVLTGESKRRYAEIKKAHRAKKVDDPGKIQKTWREAIDTPAFIVVMCAVSDDAIRREEDHGAVMMAIENLLIAAAADGIGTHLWTGGIMENDELKALVSMPAGYRIIGIISLGYEATAPEPTLRRKPLAEVVTWLD